MGLQVRLVVTPLTTWVLVQLVGMEVVIELGKAMEMLPFNATMLDRVNPRFITTFYFYTVLSDMVRVTAVISEALRVGWTYR